MNKKHLETIAVLDFGSQYTQLIARRIRENNIYSEIFPFDIDIKRLKDKNIKAIILSGGPSSVYDDDAPKLNPELLSLEIPILGICYGLQLLLYNFGGKIIKGKVGEYGNATINQLTNNSLFEKIPNQINVWMSHADKVQKINNNWKVLAQSKNKIIAAVQHSSKPIFGVQFHPEVTHTDFGKKIVF